MAVDRSGRRSQEIVLIGELLRVPLLGIISPHSRFRAKQVKFRSTCFPFDGCCHTWNKRLSKEGSRTDFNRCENWTIMFFDDKSTSSIKRQNNSWAGGEPRPRWGWPCVARWRWGILIIQHLGQRGIASAKWGHNMGSLENKRCPFHSRLTRCLTLWERQPSTLMTCSHPFQLCNSRSTAYDFTISWSSRWNVAESFLPQPLFKR